MISRNWFESLEEAATLQSFQDSMDSLRQSTINSISKNGVAKASFALDDVIEFIHTDLEDSELSESQIDTLLFKLSYGRKAVQSQAMEIGQNLAKCEAELNEISPIPSLTQNLMQQTIYVESLQAELAKKGDSLSFDDMATLIQSLETAESFKKKWEDELRQAEKNYANASPGMLDSIQNLTQQKKSLERLRDENQEQLSCIVGASNYLLQRKVGLQLNIIPSDIFSPQKDSARKEKIYKRQQQLEEELSYKVAAQEAGYLSMLDTLGKVMQMGIALFEERKTEVSSEKNIADLNAILGTNNGNQASDDTFVGLQNLIQQKKRSIENGEVIILAKAMEPIKENHAALISRVDTMVKKLEQIHEERGFVAKVKKWLHHTFIDRNQNSKDFLSKARKTLTQFFSEGNKKSKQLEVENLPIKPQRKPF